MYSLKLKNCFHLIKAIILANVTDCSQVGNSTTCQYRRCKRCGFGPWVRKIPWRRKWQHTPVFLPGESHGQRSLADSIVHRVSKSRTSDLAWTYICHTHTSKKLDFVPSLKVFWLYHEELNEWWKFKMNKIWKTSFFPQLSFMIAHCISKNIVY